MGLVPRARVEPGLGHSRLPRRRLHAPADAGLRHRRLADRRARSAPGGVGLIGGVERRAGRDRARGGRLRRDRALGVLPGARHGHDQHRLARERVRRARPGRARAGDGGAPRRPRAGRLGGRARGRGARLGARDPRRPSRRAQLDRAGARRRARDRRVPVVPRPGRGRRAHAVRAPGRTLRIAGAARDRRGRHPQLDRDPAPGDPSRRAHRPPRHRGQRALRDCDPARLHRGRLGARLGVPRRHGDPGPRFLGERITRPQILGVVLALVGVGMVAPRRRANLGRSVPRCRMARAGIEPATPRFSVACSTN